VTQSPTWIATARLLRRTGFGTTGTEVDAVVGQDWSTYLDAALAADPESDPGAVATPMPSVIMPTFPSPDASQAVNDAFMTGLLVQMGDLVSWWIRRMWMGINRYTLLRRIGCFDGVMRWYLW